MIRIFGGRLGSSTEVKYEANGSLSRSAVSSSFCCWEELEAEGSAVRIDGSNSLVLSSVRGTFSARRF